MNVASAKAAIRRLRSGIVPGTHVEALSVGYESVASLLTKNLSAASKALFVRGEWGSGKSHFIAYLRALCRRRGVPCSSVALNARGQALNYPQRLYPVITRELEWGKEFPGLATIIRKKFMSDGETNARLEQVVADSTLAPLGPSLQWLCNQHKLCGTPPSLEDLGWTVVLGEDLAWGDYGYKRVQATSRLGALGRFCARMGAPCLVLLFDEAETIDQLWNVRSRLVAYEVLGQICRFEHVWPVFAITRRFEETVDRDVGALDRLSGVPEDARWFLEHWTEGLFHRVEPPAPTRSGSVELARRVSELYEGVYGSVGSRTSTLDRVLVRWHADPGKNPRILIRMVIHALDTARPLVGEGLSAATAWPTVLETSRRPGFSQLRD